MKIFLTAIPLLFSISLMGQTFDFSKKPKKVDVTTYNGEFIMFDYNIEDNVAQGLIDETILDYDNNRYSIREFYRNYNLPEFIIENKGTNERQIITYLEFGNYYLEKGLKNTEETLRQTKYFIRIRNENNIRIIDYNDHVYSFSEGEGIFIKNLNFGKFGIPSKVNFVVTLSNGALLKVSSISKEAFECSGNDDNSIFLIAAHSYSLDYDLTNIEEENDVVEIDDPEPIPVSEPGSILDIFKDKDGNNIDLVEGIVDPHSIDEIDDPYYEFPSSEIIVKEPVFFVDQNDTFAISKDHLIYRIQNDQAIKLSNTKSELEIHRIEYFQLGEIKGFVIVHSNYDLGTFSEIHLLNNGDATFFDKTCSNYLDGIYLSKEGSLCYLCEYAIKNKDVIYVYHQNEGQFYESYSEGASFQELASSMDKVELVNISSNLISTNGRWNIPKETHQYDPSGRGIFGRKIVHRNFSEILAIKFNKQEETRIVAELCINREGEVVSVELLEETTAIFSQDQEKKIIEGIKGYRYSKDLSAPKVQCGKFKFIIERTNAFR